jgi:hypothetical protein
MARFFCTYILGSFSAFHSRFFAIAKDVFRQLKFSSSAMAKRAPFKSGCRSNLRSRLVYHFKLH